MEITIRKAGPDDNIQLHKISCTTFSDTFSDSNNPADMKLYMEKNMSIESLSAELENPLSEFFFAMMNGTVAGYLKLNYGSAQTDLFLKNSTEIERIYVSKEFQSQGIGKILLNKAFERAQVNQSEYIWLGVWEHNLKAIEFYTRNGFVKFGKHPFILGHDTQTDILMKNKISS